MISAEHRYVVLFGLPCPLLSCRPVTCYQTILRSFHDARYLVDKALTKCLQHRKPVLMEVCR
jgi:TPP-dependent 2-oxoacid decarboxylase